MKTKYLIFAAALTGSLLASQSGIAKAPKSQPAPTQKTDTRPNFLLIMADDLGWSDTGAFGGEIHTPYLDQLAKEGVRFTGLHTAPTCSPTRSMLMTGTDNHIAGVGTMAEMLPRAPFLQGHPGYEGVLNARVATVAELLQQGGYRTIMSGKWHLGLTAELSPAKRGFEQSFHLAQGLSNFWGKDQGADWGRVNGNPSYYENGKPVSYPEGTYTSDYFTDRLIGYLEAGKTDKRPFFAYLAYTAPHWPIMAPEANVAKYKGRYDKGYDVLRAERLAKQKQLGLVPQEVQPHPLVNAKPWDQLTPEEQRYEARKMEVYAGMVDNLDQNIGRVVAKLKAIGAYDNTVIVFLSDNGPEGSDVKVDGFVTNDPEGIKGLKIDNSYENIGAWNSYLGYGMGWAQANSTPSQLVKGYPTEGGTRVISFASGKGVVGNGRINHGHLSVQDIPATFLDLAGITHPTHYQGRAIAPLRGKSLAPILSGAKEEIRSPDEALGTELFFARALRKGDWKAVFLPDLGGALGRVRVGDNKWKLYNIAKDPGETTDLSAQEPAKLKELVADWKAYARDTGVIIPAPLAAPLGE